jgi:ferredoxin
MQFVDRRGFEGLLTDLVGRGFRLVGPTVRDGAIVLDEIESPAELPRGVGEEQEAGRYRVVRRSDDRWFGFAHGPDSAKRFLFPGREVLGTAVRENGDLRLEPAGDEDDRPIAFVGIRSCDLHAVAIQDRVFLDGPAPDPAYARRRREAVFVAVNCETPGGTCFCASMETGPRCTQGFDVALTEFDDGFVAEPGTELGRELLAAADARQATPEEERADRDVTERAISAMGRVLETGDMPDLLYRNREHPRWLEVGDRCLACGNCTSACPTCFCHDVVDTTDILGTTATRTREWASCFSDEFSHTVGGDVRTARSSRYRQWLTHKFASWIDQFGTSGCVGCGRCITWCPVGIDVTEEIAAIRIQDGVVVAVADS